MTRRLTLIMAAACGLVVANLYYAQPLLHTIGEDLHVSTGAVGLLVTATQIGYAVGLVFIVPLGDLHERRRLLAVLLALTTVGLVAAAVAPDLSVLALALCAVGLTSVVAQILVPFAATLAPEDERGRIVGVVMSGLLIGILLARTASGLIAAALGWRSVYVIAAVLMVGLAVVLWRELPHVDQPVTLRYRQLLASIVAIAREEPLVLRRGLLGAFGFACFSVFWTSAAFLLAGPPYHYGEGVIGLFGLVGVAGAAMATYAGRLADAGHTVSARTVLLALMAASFALLGWGGHHLAPFIAGVVVLDLAVQGTHILNQSDIYELRPESRSRITTIYMTCYFAGGAIGSALSAAVYSSGGWGAVCWLGGGLGVAALAVWLVELLTESRARTRRMASEASSG
jgi:predicted MFS family arabinose efflux permease